MPKIRYTPAEINRLTDSLLQFFDPDHPANRDDPQTLEKWGLSRFFLKEWCIKEDVYFDNITEIYKKRGAPGKRFLAALNKCRQITELRLALLMIREPKRAIPIIFSLKNTAGWRDFPEEKGQDIKKRLILELHLPTKLSSLPQGVTPQRNKPYDQIKDAKFAVVSASNKTRSLGLPENRHKVKRAKVPINLDLGDGS